MPSTRMKGERMYHTVLNARKGGLRFRPAVLRRLGGARFASATGTTSSSSIIHYDVRRARVHAAGSRTNLDERSEPGDPEITLLSR